MRISIYEQQLEWLDVTSWAQYTVETLILIRGGGSPRRKRVTEFRRICKETSGYRSQGIGKKTMIHIKNEGVVYLDDITNSVESNATEKAMSRKCEGQLSSTKANSCSSYKGANRTTEMAQEDSYPCWNNLPSVILQEIFSYLSHNNRLRASQVCRNWRYALFHPSFWKKITFALGVEDRILWSRFLSESFGFSVQEATIRCETLNHSVDEILNILKKLSCNRQLRKLFLECSSSCFVYEDEEYSNGCFLPLMKPIVKIIETTNCLEALSLGCVEDLSCSANVFLTSLYMNHAKHLTTLSLASVRDDPEYQYQQMGFENELLFSSFIRLSILTLDYEYLNDNLLKALDNGVMERLVIHLHGWNENYAGTSDSAWQTFVQRNPKCELRLNLIHSYVGIEMLHSEILCRSMPLTHLKVLFCESINSRALLVLSGWYYRILKSLIWVDSIDPKKIVPETCDPTEFDSPDPLVLIAWKCSELAELVFIGHKYYLENLLAIARLRGSSLKSLVFAERDILFYAESQHMAESITLEIQDIIGHHWEQLSNDDLPAVVKNPFTGDSRDVIMPFVLRDQK